MVCKPEESTDDYSPKEAGEVCSSLDGAPTTVNICDNAGQCTHQEQALCTIDGQAWNAGQHNTSNECEFCDPQTSTTSWTYVESGISCTSANNRCDKSVCNGEGTCGLVTQGCLINDKCFEEGQANPTNSCLVCNPTVSQTDYTVADSKDCVFLEGGGCDCTSVGSGTQSSAGSKVGLLALLGIVVERLRRRRSVRL